MTRLPVSRRTGQLLTRRRRFDWRHLLLLLPGIAQMAAAILGMVRGH